MASALHIYANLLWRDNRVEARIKKVAALRLLQEPHYRLHLDELSNSLVSGLFISRELLAPDQLADVMSADTCFVYSEGTGNILLDAASLMAAGKDCLKAQIGKVWDMSSPLSWARNQLAWYIVSRQHIDMRPADLFLVAVDDAESFLAAAWTARMDLRDHSEQPYSSLWELLGGEARFEMTPDQNGIRLNFHKLLQPQDTFQMASASQHLKQLLQTQQQFSSASNLGNGHDHRARESSATVTDWAQSASDDGAGDGVGGYGDLEATMQRVKLPPPQRLMTHGPGAPNGPFGHSDFNGEGAGVEESYEDAEEYGEGGEDYDENDVEARAHGSRTPGGGGGGGSGGGGTGTSAGGRYASVDGGGTAAAAPLAYSGGGTVPTRPISPLRPDLLPQYVRAVWGTSGSPHDHLMAVVALALADAGRGPGSGSNRWQAPPPPPPPPGSSTETHRFCMPLPLLVAHVREVAPHLLPTTAAGPHDSTTTAGHEGILVQRLREYPSRGCFRVLLSGSTTGPADGEASHHSNGACGEVDGEEALAVLDLEVLRERVIEALTSAAAAVFSGSRPVDEIRRTAAVHLATRTRPFAGRVHCVRLSTLARALAEQLPPDVFDPTRLSGFERLVGSESSSNVMHVFRKLLPGGPVGGGGASHVGSHGEELGTFVTLNLGKLLAAAGIRELEGLAPQRSGRGEGRGGDGALVSGAAWGGARGASDAAPSAAAAAAAAASRAAAFAAASATAHAGRDMPPPPPPPLVHPHGSNSVPPPPSDAALRRAVETLFPVPDGGRGGSGEYAVLAAAAKRTAALSLVKALHTQQGGFLSLDRLTDIVDSVMAGAPDLEQLLASEPDFFEIKGAWYGGTRSVRLRSSAVMARVGGLASAPTGTTSGAVANGSGNHGQPVTGGSESLPRRPNTLNCPYYMRHGTCGFGVTCKYNHPPLAPRPPGESSPAPAASAAVGSPVPSGAPPQRSASFRPQPQRPQPLQQQQQQETNSHVPGNTATTPVTASAQTTSDGSSAAVAGGGPAASRMSPASLEVKIVTTACNPVHIDMLQHCYAAPQVALACKVRHSSYTHPANASGIEVGQVCLVQLYAPAVAAPGGSGPTHGSGGDGPGGPGGSAAGGGGGGSGSAPRWPATVYLIDPAAGEDRNGLLLPSLSALLEDPAVPKVVYCGSEVVPYMPRISPLYDISILHALLARAPHAVLGPTVGAAELAAVPPLGSLLQQHWVMNPAAAAAAAAAPAHSPTWAARPLADDLRQQAVLEVVHLASLWTGLMTRLAKLPLQLSQAAADRLHLDHSERSAAATAAGASAIAATGPPLMHPAARAPAVAVPAGVAVLVPAVPVAPPGLPAAGQQRGVMSMHRIGW